MGRVFFSTNAISLPGATVAHYKVLPGFHPAREKLKAATDRRPLLRELFSRGQVKRLLSADTDKSFLPQLQRRVIAVAEHCLRPDRGVADLPEVDQIYRLLRHRMSQTEPSVAWLHKLVGEYRYFRYHVAKGNFGGKPVEGGLKVGVTDAGSFVFEHRSHDWPTEEPDPEHRGWVLRKHGNVYFIGMNVDVVRLGVLECSIEEDPKKKIMDGLVLSARSGTSHAPFAARAAILSTEHPDLSKWTIDPANPITPHMLDRHCQEDANRFMSL